jgi:mersacidin/lichenicidin family type 2 lantibiotic
MTTEQIISSWKNDEYTANLSAVESALIPDNPAGMMELSDEELMGVTGANPELSIIVVTIAIIVVTA